MLWILDNAVFLVPRNNLGVAPMVGKFLKRGAIVDTIKSGERMIAVQKRSGKTMYHVDVVSCGCPDENCGAFHVLREDRPLPTAQEALDTLLSRQRQRKTVSTK